jgi:hypothetical protein
MPDLSLIWSIVELALKDRGQLALENAAPRHQLAVLKRSVKRAKIQDSDRIFWMLLRRSLKDWKEALIFVKPDTVVKWHRRGFRYYWKQKSRSKPGRPPVGMAIIMLIKRLSKENETWGAPRITDELALLGHEVAEATVAKYMIKHRKTGTSQTWRTFIQNHLHETAACDFFTVPTATFKVLYCFVVLSLDRRWIVHVNVTDHSTAAWTARLYWSGDLRTALGGSEVELQQSERVSRPVSLDGVPLEDTWLLEASQQLFRYHAAGRASLALRSSARSPSLPQHGSDTSTSRWGRRSALFATACSRTRLQPAS